MAREHLNAKLILEGTDLLGDTGLRGVQRLRRLGDVQATAHHLGQISKLLKLHAL